VQNCVDLGGRRIIKKKIKLSLHGDQIDRRSRDTLIGDSPAMRQIRATIVKLARSQAPILITGESGTGKDLVARLIHSKSPRADQPFIAVNCGAIPGELMESEFFGHRKGSFTGAASDKDGLFQAADGGTLFLDEVGDLPLSLQVKLLRAIQEKSVRRIGDPKEIRVDVRILSATHTNLSEAVRDGAFRQDLFYRINVIELHVPPLRDRGGDIAQLAERILARIATENGLPGLTLTRAALDELGAYAFPGNVRELENVLERAVAMCDETEIKPDDLLLEMGPDPGRSGESPAYDRSMPLDRYIDDVEKRAILEALEKTRWNKTAAARVLGLPFRSLRYRLKRLGLD
jgi:two-component system response regulator PilR (NtrC family)